MTLVPYVCLKVLVLVVLNHMSRWTDLISLMIGIVWLNWNLVVAETHAKL